MRMMSDRLLALAARMPLLFIEEIAAAYEAADGDPGDPTDRRLIEPWIENTSATVSEDWQKLMDALARVDEQRGWRPFEQHGRGVRT